MNEVEVNKAIETLLAGGVIAYPTESCYGLGCLPTEKAGVDRILVIKQRCWTKGLILVGSNFKQFSTFTQVVSPHHLTKAQATWPGPYTWLFPVSASCPVWIKGEFESVALRISAHEFVRALCARANSAIVSTSANRQGESAVTEYADAVRQFGKEVDYILPGHTGGDTNPSEIRDLLTDTIIRSA